MKTLGIIAGNGRFPLLALREARKQDYRIVVGAIVKEADESIAKLADACCWVKIGELKKLVKFFQSEGVHEAIMAGKIEKVRLFQENVKPDLEMFKIILKVRDFKDDSLLKGIADYLKSEGIQLLDSTFLMQGYLPSAGPLGKKKPSNQILNDIHFGFDLAKQVAGLDVGQTVVVKKRAILAVEAIEGTDLAIRRGSELGGHHTVVVKVAKPNQDMRFDVPAIGLKTLRELIHAKAAALAFEADKTLFLDRDQFIDEANQKGIVLYGVSHSHERKED